MSSTSDDKNKKIYTPPIDNIIIILLYSFSLASVLGLAGLVNSIFIKLGYGEIISKIIYVTIMFVITILLAYLTGKRVPF
jgi:hypothetical protein